MYTVESLAKDPVAMFMYALKSPESKRQYPKRFKMFLDFLLTPGDLNTQAKKWDGTIGRPEIQKFAGALQGQRPKRGIFITTGNFSAEAEEYVSKIENKIVLVDGNQLTEYMIDKNIGVTLEKPYSVKKLGLDYFEELA